MFQKCIWLLGNKADGSWKFSLAKPCKPTSHALSPITMFCTTSNQPIISIQDMIYCTTSVAALVKIYICIAHIFTPEWLKYLPHYNETALIDAIQNCEM